MKKVITTGTPCICPVGAAGLLKGTGKLIINNLKVVMESDTDQNLNGWCTILQKNCKFESLGKWQNTSKTISIHGEAVAISSSILNCISGGKIIPKPVINNVEVEK